jgi:hypothetical protein
MTAKASRRMPRSKLLRQVTEERAPEGEAPDESAPEEQETLHKSTDTSEHSDASTSIHTDASADPKAPTAPAETEPAQATKPEPKPPQQTQSAPTTPPAPSDPPELRRGRQRPALSATWSRTTVLIEPSVFRRLRFQAVTEDRTFSEIITDALRQYLDQQA